MAKPTTKADTGPVKMLRIVAMKDGFRRAGIAHSTKPSEYPAADFSEEQIEQLKAEPMLVVQEFEASPSAPAEEEKK